MMYFHQLIYMVAIYVVEVIGVSFALYVSILHSPIECKVAGNKNIYSLLLLCAQQINFCSLMSQIKCGAYLCFSEGWFTDAHNQAMRFGDLPSWAVELSAVIHEAICVGDVNASCGVELKNEDEDACPLPSDLLWRKPLFDQLIANRYKPGEGICAHVDLMRFDDGIAIVSLESPCVMHFSRAEQEVVVCDTLESGHAESTKIPVYLNPGSLVLMSGDARYLWKHEINRKPGGQQWGGRELEQQIRTSITLRKLLASPN
ncbi:hypothetical protein E2562_019668 [Oryza meyeriana var. granulata]|uniref:Fe2OG dioxygenase domain-containing protein n=1 Tax=Oryza meyeriana var. granulata TaxID=110450 RepID=A0A6G1C7H3_9ORYZ|nr:hypothetical protein E2562_019668 [Oryza meyeriana var. granulata]